MIWRQVNLENQDQASRLAALVFGFALLLATTAGCGRVGQGGAHSIAAPEAAIPQAAVETSSRDEIASNGARLDALRRQGNFEEFVRVALVEDSQSDNPAHGLLRVEACLASGDPSSAALAAEQAAAAAIVRGDQVLAAQAIKLWATARLRQGEPLDDARLASALRFLPADDAAANLVRYWIDALGSRAAYCLEGPHEWVEAPRSASEPFSTAAELNAITARVNGVALAGTFIDSGAQHTVLSREAARAAGVRMGDGETELVGFGGVAARPGLIDSLQIGELTIRDVPVLIGDSGPLLAAQGQLALGMELLHHVQVRLDYPNRRVYVARPDAPREQSADAAAWRIGLWTFSQSTLAQGRLPDATAARVLIDTGNRAGSFISQRFAESHLASASRASKSFIFKFRARGWQLSRLELGDRALESWKVVDTMPAELDRLDAVDLLVGHDLLGEYETTIDLERREIVLRQAEPRLGATTPSLREN